MLALGPLASAYGQSVWRRFERLAAAQDVIKGDGFAATSDSVYDRLLTALGFLSQDPAEWAQGFTQSDLWRTRILQTQLASWACVRRSVARYTTVHIYGGRSDASPRILVDPYPLAFGGLASAMRKAKDCLGALLGDDETASDLADLASDLDVLREVANGGVDAARQHSRPLARIVDGLGVWFGNGTMGDEEVLLAAHPQGQLYIGIGIPRRLVVRLRVDGDLVSYEGAVMSYRERWEGVPIVVEQPGGGVDWNVYDWGGRASGRREGR